VGLRAIELIPEGKLDAVVTPGMRTPKELVVHMYGQVLREVAEGALKGRITDEPERNEKQIAARLKTRADLLRYCHDCWNAADRATQAMTDKKLMVTTSTPWGMSFPAFVAYTMIHDEYFHHRGQLHVYLRAMGIAPPAPLELPRERRGVSAQSRDGRLTRAREALPPGPRRARGSQTGASGNPQE
jgi:uncharacterized damage-inducible protein DinB